MKRFSQKLLFVVAVMLIAVMAFTGCTANNTGSSGTSMSESQEQNIGSGSTVFVLEVTDDKENVTTFNVSTDEKTVGAALLETGLAEGEDTQYGLNVKTVNGLTADYDTDNAFWAFYIDGDFASSGVDSTEIDPSKVYALVYTAQ